MNSAIRHGSSRSDQITYVSSELLPRAALLTRLLISQLGGDLSLTEVGVLNTLNDGPRRITELAQFERLAQPTMTILVKRLERQGLVKRERQGDDGRVVHVNLTDAGTVALEDYRAQASATLDAYLSDMPDETVDALTATTATLTQLVTLLQQAPIA